MQDSSDTGANAITEHAPHADRPLRTTKTKWRGAILICGKCVKTHADGKALRHALKIELKRRAAAAPGKRKVRIVRTACLGLCPRRAVVVASPATLATNEVVLMRNESEVAAALARLLTERPSEPSVG